MQTSILNPGNLPSFHVKITHSKDQLVRTPKGGVFFIKSNTFDSDVELEIKEAYTMKDILLAGLHTESNGKPMKSGGMIYINTKNGETVALNKPISIIMPANYIDSSMSLFKGEVMDDNNINWLPADTLQPTIASESIKAGKLLYVSNCANCHAVKKDIAAPALAGLQNRGRWKDSKEVLKWIHNPPGYMANDRSGYTLSLKNKFGVMMPPFPQLKQKDIDNLIAFVRNEEKQQVTDTFASPFEKPCNGFDTIYYNEKDTLHVPQEEMETLLDTTTYPSIQTNGEGMRGGFTDERISDGAYRFEIATLGWYNVDAELEPQPNTVLCDLKVVTNAPNDMNDLLTVYAFFPKNKNLSVGISHGKNSFSFEKVKGKIPLYLGDKGVIVAFGNVRDQFFYGTKMFTVQKNQTINVTVSITTQEQFLNRIKSEQLEGINFDVIKQQMRIVPCNDNKATDSSMTK
jgi:mono/diheme cytochrome c family protein